MSEEIINDPTPTEENAASESPSLNLDQTIQVNGEQVSVQDLLAAREKANQLEEYRRHASHIMRSEGGFAEKEESTRYIMTQEGYTPDQIEEYVAASKQYENQVQESQQPQSQPASPEPQDDRVTQLEQRLGQAEQEAAQRKLDQMKVQRKQGVDEVASSAPIQQILEASKRINGDKEFEQTETLLKQDIERETLAILKRERAAKGNITDASFAQAAKAAAESVSNRYRAVIGDPNSLGRAPQTGMAPDLLYQKKPVEDPKYVSGENPGQVYDKARNFAEQSLLNIAADVSSGGESKL